MKKFCTYFYNLNYYTLYRMRNVTREQGGEKWYSFEEFHEIIGITVAYYDAHVDLFKDMRHDDMVKWLEENPDWDKE